MSTVALLRKSTDAGVRTWRFTESGDGQFMAISDRCQRRWYPSRRSLDLAIEGFRSYGFTDFHRTLPVRRGAKQLIMELAAVS